MVKDLRQIVCSELFRLGKSLGVINRIYQNYLREQQNTTTSPQTSYVNGKIENYEFVLDTLTANGSPQSQYFVMFKKGERNIFRYWPDLEMGILTDNFGSMRILVAEEAIKELVIKAFDLNSDGKSVKNPIVFDY